MPIKIGRGGSGSTSVNSGTLTVLDEGVSLSTDVQTINIVGTDIEASLTAANTVTIYSPPPTYVSHFNTSDGTNDCSVASISTTGRYISNPTAEGTPFKIGDWGAGTSQATTQSGTWVFTTTNQCLFENLTSTIEVNVYDADEVSILATHTTGAISGNTDVTVNNIQIQVTSWATESTKYKGIITITVNIAAIIANGGRIGSVAMVHHNVADYTKTQTSAFYDDEPAAASLTGVTITETGGSVVTRFISGVEYYFLGSDFSISIADIDDLNANTYPLTQVNIEGTEYGLPSLNLQGSDLTGWTNAWDDDNSTYNKTDWAITQTNLFSASTTGNIRARTQDWSAGGWVNSSNSNILIHTHNTTNTDTTEYFFYENYRCPTTGNFDLANQKSWTSSSDVGVGDAIFYNGGCERINTLANSGDFTLYNPNSGSQPNYSASQNATVYLIREFLHTGVASSGFTINLTGTYTSLEMKMAKAWDGTSTGGTVWVDMAAGYNAPQWNNGNPTGGTGSLTGGSHHTFGTNNIINTSDTIYIRIGFTGANRITQLNVVFD